MHFNFRHLIMSSCNDTRYPNININHHSHRYKKGTHSRKDYIALIFIITTLVISFTSAGFVPVWNKRNRKLYVKTNNNTDNILVMIT